MQERETQGIREEHIFVTWETIEVLFLLIFLCLLFLDGIWIYLHVYILLFMTK